MKNTIFWTALIGLLFIVGCTTTKSIDHASPSQTQKQASLQKKLQNKKSPISVAFYDKGQTPKKPYKILGTETVSKFNLVGIKRQEASIQDAMRNLAASMGGDAIINIERNDKSVSGTVIAYQSPEEKDIATAPKNQG